MFGLKTEGAFDSAHFLTDYYGTCENLHGHRWRVVVYLAQEDLQDEGTMRDMVLGARAQRQRDDRPTAVSGTAVDKRFPFEHDTLTARPYRPPHRPRLSERLAPCATACSSL